MSGNLLDVSSEDDLRTKGSYIESMEGTLLDDFATDSTEDDLRTKDNFLELMKSYNTTQSEEEVEMDEPVKCYYHKTNSIGDPIEKKMIQENLFPDQMEVSERDIPMECRGITLRQLRGVWALVERRCENECWKNWKDEPLTLDTITSHDVKKYVVKPFTEETKKSFVESLPSTAGYQPPRISVSAMFNLPFKELLACVEAFVDDFRTNSSYDHDEKGGGMTENTPVWLWLFAMDAWDENFSYPDDPTATPFAKAIEAAKHRVLSISDKDGQYFTRTWCVFETILALKKGRWYVYTPHSYTHKGCEKEAVGLIDGGATSDVLPVDTLERENDFPIDLIVKCIKFRIQDATAQERKDRKNVLEWCIKDANKNDEGRTDPTQVLRNSEELRQSKNKTFRRKIKKERRERLNSTEHAERACIAANYALTLNYHDSIEALGDDKEYDIINDRFHAHFTTAGTLQSALLEDELSWNEMLDIMRKGYMKQMRLDFGEGKGWDKLTEDKAVALIESLPCTIESLEIQCADFNSEFIDALGDWVVGSKLKRLHLVNTLLNQNIEHDAIVNFAWALDEVKETLEDLQIWRVNEDLESIVVERDLKTVGTMLESGNIAKALYAPLKQLYQHDNPDFYKITFLQTLYMNHNRTHVVDFSMEKVEKMTLDWANGLSDSKWKRLMQTKAGSFVKTVFNHQFTRGGHVSIIMLNLYVQLTIVTILCVLNEGVNNDFWFGVCEGVLIFCFGLIFLKELLQMSSSYVKAYVTDGKNMIDILQIGLVAWVIIVMIRGEDSYAQANASVYGMSISWVALMFELSYFFYTLATFVTATIQILKGLFPFLFTAIFINLMFAHIYRAKYMEEKCDDQFEDGWKQACSSLFVSYSRTIRMFLTNNDWNFDEKPGMVVTFLYAFVMGILLLNIVIAVVSNKFKDVQDNAKRIFYRHRYSIIYEHRCLWSCFLSLRTRIMGQEPDKYTDMESEKKLARFSFQCKASYNEVKNIRQLEDKGLNKVGIKNLNKVVDWWFHPYGLECPGRIKRMKVFFRYSIWEDIIFPGLVFERMVLGLNYNAKMKYDTLHPLLLLSVKILSWLFFMCNLLVIIIYFICGLMSFGVFWPMEMKEYLFHEHGGDIIEEKDVLSVDVEKVKGELRDIKRVMREEREEMIIEMKQLVMEMAGCRSSNIDTSIERRNSV